LKQVGAGNDSNTQTMPQRISLQMQVAATAQTIMPSKQKYSQAFINF
jgi:hypothetical protein